MAHIAQGWAALSPQALLPLLTSQVAKFRYDHHSTLMAAPGVYRMASTSSMPFFNDDIGTVPSGVIWSIREMVPSDLSKLTERNNVSTPIAIDVISSTICLE